MPLAVYASFDQNPDNIALVVFRDGPNSQNKLKNGYLRRKRENWSIFYVKSKLPPVFIWK